MDKNAIKCNGELVTKTIKATDITGLEVSGSIDVKYTNGPVSIKLTAPSDAMQYINLSVRDGILSMSIKDNKSLMLPTNVRALLTVSSPDLSNITSKGTGDVVATNLTGDKVWIQTYGTGDITAEKITSTEAELKSFGTGDIKISGVEGSNLVITTSGTGDISVMDILAEDITAISTGTGDITLKGQCKNANLTTSGTGDIKVGRLKAGNWNLSESGAGEIDR